ncbi:hypothetical protein THF1C08_260010 [Vibrio jasicida]|uniref:Uncharacterized protein n=1 Tax=Vibrio jasicida TaxID=766224 RepID=A0AAU9QVP3_9VIBR|nr:hypothetical protein THF1C08_260010 [Vibrio jasicida]CAH1602985.1 hypothetical protein THF1A12_610010 [Vibrio jasicida]
MVVVVVATEAPDEAEVKIVEKEDEMLAMVVTIPMQAAAEVAEIEAEEKVVVAQQSVKQVRIPIVNRLGFFYF